MRLIYIYIILAINSLVAGEIITTNDFRLIENEAYKLDGDSLLLFDVDATLIVPNDALLRPKGKDLFEQLIASYPCLKSCLPHSRSQVVGGGC